MENNTDFICHNPSLRWKQIHPYHLPKVASEGTIGPRILCKFQISNKTWGSHLNFLKNAQFFLQKVPVPGLEPGSPANSTLAIGRKTQNFEITSRSKVISNGEDF
uniref:Uncharacterized protein n=1 Tax=Cacopsylla melanoneura TaxID=428564 RepID=A0A8D8V9T4_9HEMI